MPDGLQDDVDRIAMDRIDEMYASAPKDKFVAGRLKRTIQDDVLSELDETYPDMKKAVKGAFKDLLCRRMYALAANSGKRVDGRDLDQVRPITIDAGILPRVHGSALFTRGETQAIATATLGDSAMRQKIEKIDGKDLKRFYLQYTFPPSCVGETGRVGAPGRREVGHGNLAER